MGSYPRLAYTAPSSLARKHPVKACCEDLTRLASKPHDITTYHGDSRIVQSRLPERHKGQSQRRRRYKL